MKSIFIINVLIKKIFNHCLEAPHMYMVVDLHILLIINEFLFTVF
jgi:hypothetical protein